MQIVVASGKGGTGKSLVSLNLALSLSEQMPVTLVDCDAEEPNLHLFSLNEEIKEEQKVFVTIPSWNKELCTYCGLCGEFCQYGAIVVLPEQILFFQEHCHSCGGCSLVCPEKAITEINHQIGSVISSDFRPNCLLITGKLNPGEIRTPPVISASLNKAKKGLVIRDAPPGVACPVIESVSGADVCVLVTESTPFGLHDLKAALELTRVFGIPAGVVINKSDGKDSLITDYCHSENLPIFLTIPFTREIALIQGSGKIIAEQDATWKDAFLMLYHDIEDLIRGQK